MADINAICVALAEQINDQTGLRAFGRAPLSIAPPACVVIPGRPAITYGVTMDGEANISLLAIVVVSAANDASGQDQLLKYVSTSGAQSIFAAVQADPTLEGACEFAEVMQVSTYGLVEYAGQQYLGATFVVQVGAHM